MLYPASNAQSQEWQLAVEPVIRVQIEQTVQTGCRKRGDSSIFSSHSFIFVVFVLQKLLLIFHFCFALTRSVCFSAALCIKAFYTTCISMINVIINAAVILTKNKFNDCVEDMT